jgi:hypothetical protein
MEKEMLKDCFRVAIPGVARGDALGAPFEEMRTVNRSAL